MKESPAPGEQRRVVLLGATGSIGQQVLDVVRRNRDQFRLVGLAGGGGDVAGLAAAAMEFGVEVVAVARGTVAQDLQLAFYAAAKAHGWSAGEFQVPKLLVGPDAATELATLPCDIVLNGITGSVGLGPTLAALDAGTTLALANKESLIAGGSLVLSRAKPGQLVPVDSEHSALAQCLRGGRADEVRKLVLTASGGPFRGRSREQMAGVTVAEALAHPTWAMGPVITINSATLVNKGLELIEAHLLFGIDVDAIDVVVHPQSVVHSMVEFHDGSTLAQCSPPDMRLPIAMALGWPDRVAGAASAVDWTAAQSWTFEPLDATAFPSVGLARAAARTGGLAPAVYNAANEELVAGFAHGLVGFTAIVDTIDAVLGQADPHLLAAPTTIEEVVAAEQWARTRAREIAGLPADYAVRMPPVRAEGSPVA